MRSIIVLCFAAIVFAQYDYQPSGQVSGGGFEGNDGIGAGVTGDGDTGLAGIGSGPSFGSHGDLSGVSNASPAVVPQTVIEKEFYTFAANDNDFNDDGAPKVTNSARQALRVVFIKSPENRGLEDAALALAKQAGEQKTVIYVLSKQTDVGDLANKLNNLSQNGNNKPEVHFVKYRTPEDAANAQRAIQNQYDSLGGNTKSINAGVAPVLDFASKATSVTGPSNSYVPPASNYGSGSQVSSPSNSYVPPASTPAEVSAPATTYVPPASTTEAPSNTYVPPAPAPVAVDDPNVSYLPASILRLFRL